MSEVKSVMDFAEKQGYESAYLVLKWNGYDVYQPVFSDEMSYIGLPLMILVKGEKIRMTTPDEAFEIFDIMNDVDEEIGTKNNDKKITGDSFFSKIKYFFKRGGKSIPVKEKDSEEDIYNRKEYAKGFGVSDENAELISKYGVLDENGMPMILYRGSTVSPKDDNGGSSVLCPDKKVFCLSDKEYKAVGHGLVHRYFLISKKPYFVNKIKDTQKEFVNGNYDVAISKGNGEDVEYTSKNKENLILID